MKRLVFYFFLIIYSFLNAQGSSYNLFHIGRSKDLDIIKYDINLDEKGEIIKEKPLKIYWVRYTDSKKIERLSFIQNALAYGVDYLSISEKEIKFQFVSYDKMTFVVKKTSSGRFKAYTELKDEPVEAEKIFVQIDGGTFMIPQISYVQFFWTSFNGKKKDVAYIHP